MTSKKITQTRKSERLFKKIVIRPKGVSTFKIPKSALVKSENKDIVLFEHETNGVSQKIIKSPEGELTVVNNIDERVVQDVENSEVISETFIKKIKGLRWFWIVILVVFLLLLFFVIFLIKKKVKLWNWKIQKK